MPSQNSAPFQAGQIIFAAHNAAGDAVGVQFFRAIKSMTISGYYATEIGLRQELGDDGQLMLLEFHGCDHPEHQA